MWRVRSCQDDYLTPNGMQRYGRSQSIAFSTREEAERAHQKLIDAEEPRSMSRMFVEDFWIEEDD